MNLYILRHGIAEGLSPRNRRQDSERALTAEGRQKVRKLAKAIKALGVTFDEVLSSPYRRARETAEIVVDQLKRPKVQLTKKLTPSGNVQELLDEIGRLQATSDEILLVGHEPYLSQLVSLLVFGKTSATIILKKGGLCKLSFLSLRQGRCAALEWLLTPKQMLMMT